MTERQPFTADDVRFEIRFALGQAPAQLYVDARAKDRTKREAALDNLAARIAARFATIEMTAPPPAATHSIGTGPQIV